MPSVRAGALARSASGVSTGRAEHLRELVRSRDLELIVSAVVRALIRAPALEHRRVPESIALHVVVFDLAHALDAQRLPRQILAGAPPALTAWHAGHVRAVVLGPLPPRMTVERVRAKRRELLRELTAHGH